MHQLCQRSPCARIFQACGICLPSARYASECYLSDVPRPFKKTLSGYKEQEKNLLDLIYQKYLGSPLNAKEEQLLKEIDDDMLWFDLTYLLNEPQEREAPEIHITIDYTVRAFEETEKEYLELYSFFTH